ncbi:TetR/AcrR family transcriptional regulator [Candidatus Protofrankia californiensis]|uniref:TetR/AcrR family transcriptional regulator n=1 Tax=Candidatus Protofrankia californiensis TaxID=1839754 RepID=UPI001041A594|nr:TetR/AcrR family transcriptional regulator [Candidatus Protofrankia californiensis]
MAHVTQPASRRERLRLATIDEIKQIARGQLDEHGAAGVSLRAVARAMGLTPSALYRYFTSRDELIAALIADGLDSLADALEDAFKLASTDDHARRWLDVTRTYRRWSHEHVTEYILIFGTLGLDYTPPADQPCDGCDGTERSVTVLFRCMADAIDAGLIDLSRFVRELTPALRAQLEAWRADTHNAIPPAGLAACLIVWTQLHGFLSLELFGHLPSAISDASTLFDQQMLDVLLRCGYQGPVDFTTG